jgi:sarcosine oxidase subunit gamma
MSAAAGWSQVEGRARTGFKGPAALAWLASQGLPAPATANRWIAWPAGQGVIARLGSSEFFIEAAAGAVAAVDTALAASPAVVYAVMRADAAFLLEGAGAHDVLAQVCNVNFAGLDLASAPIVMTLMIGVAVLVLPEAAGDARRYRIWCDPSYGEYLHHELSAIVNAAGPAAAAVMNVI